MCLDPHDVLITKASPDTTAGSGRASSEQLRTASVVLMSEASNAECLSPSCPDSFQPQTYKSPSAEIKKECLTDSSPPKYEMKLTVLIKLHKCSLFDLKKNCLQNVCLFQYTCFSLFSCLNPLKVQVHCSGLTPELGSLSGTAN